MRNCEQIILSGLTNFPGIKSMCACSADLNRVSAHVLSMELAEQGLSVLDYSVTQEGCALLLFGNQGMIDLVLRVEVAQASTGGRLIILMKMPNQQLRAVEKLAEDMGADIYRFGRTWYVSINTLAIAKVLLYSTDQVDNSTVLPVDLAA
jgi:hypothetical protein